MGFLKRWAASGCIGLLAAFTACSDAPAPTPPDASPQFQAVEPTLRRLSVRQYLNSVETLLGPAARSAASPPDDLKLHGFQSIAASQFALNDSLASAYESSAQAIATVAIADRDRMEELMGCTPNGVDDSACQQSFIERFGRLAWRRPVSPAESEDYLIVAQKAALDMDDFYQGIRYSISTMLQSPNFIYQILLGEPDPTQPEVRHLNGYELAAKVSFFLLDTTPNEALLDLAEDGWFDDPEQRRLLVQSLIEQPQARQAVTAFFEEYLTLDELPKVTKDLSLFPTYSESLRTAMRAETSALIADVIFERNAPLGELLDADYTFMNEQLAEHYGVAYTNAKSWAKMELPSDQARRGILTHASIMSLQAHPTSTSVTHRGLFIMERFLCLTMPPPPPSVVTELPPSSVAPTMRERLAAHLEEPACANCHYMSDNLGLIFENFDAIGAYRAKENGVLIDTSVDIASLGSFDDPVELASYLASSPEVMQCIVRNLYRHASGHVETEHELPAIEALFQNFQDSGYLFKELLVELMSSRLFSVVGDIK